MLDAFVGFANRVNFYGQAICCVDDENVRGILPRISKRTTTCGLSEDADYVASGARRRDALRRHREGPRPRQFQVKMPGVHNVRNALAAVALCDLMTVHPESIRTALRDAEGQRRFTIRAQRDDVTVVDDYAHHPTEIAATLAGARARFPEGRIVALVQPHRYSRVRDSIERFPGSLTDADEVIFTEIYPAGEAPIEGISGAAHVAATRALRPERPTSLAPDLDSVAAELCARLSPGDVVLAMGAGSITRVSLALADAVESRATERA